MKVGKGVLKNVESSKVVNSELLQAVESPLAMEAKVSEWIFQCDSIENKLNPSESIHSINNLGLAVITINDEGGDVVSVRNEVEGNGPESRSPRTKSPRDPNYADKRSSDKISSTKSSTDKFYKDKSTKNCAENERSSGLKSSNKPYFKSEFKYIENELTVEHEFAQHSTGKKRSKERSRSKSKSRSQKSDDKPLTVKHVKLIGLTGENTLPLL